ncbi:hypothetical protein ACQ4LE_000593 [Meloidogyne hapla]|uniref:BZIP domain-containing protein n=1 Tax=Meloidogyne hapla TaxID=6305 RepID=A0A1I8BYH8_MELHA
MSSSSSQISSSDTNFEFTEEDYNKLLDENKVMKEKIVNLENGQDKLKEKCKTLRRKMRGNKQETDASKQKILDLEKKHNDLEKKNKDLAEQIEEILKIK